MATARNAASYASLLTGRYEAERRKLGGALYPIPFTVTIVSVSATNDTYKLTQIPANAKVIGLDCVSDGLGASAGVGSVKIGDSGDDDRYMVQTDLHTTGVHGVLAITGAGYTPTEDTDVVLKVVGGATAAKIITGVIHVILEA